MRRFFQQRNSREQFLIVALLWVALSLWVSASLRSFGDLRQRWQSTRDILDAQALTLGLASGIDEELAAIYQTLDPAKTYNAAELAAKIDTLAREQGINYTARTPHTETQDIIYLHQLSLSIKDATLDKLLPFDHAIRAQTPYIALQKISLQANAANPTQLTATFVINAFELREPSQPSEAQSSP